MPENENQSRIIITTRDSRVATMVDIDKHSYFLGPLKETESFDLFCKKVFSNRDGRRCPDQLKDLAKGIVAKCDGLP
ncbi:hypothetical protein AMTR_s00061p00145890 [Amborella trichopoda]|uniref:NB-ARC domain-containing protein n=1 Tax=Amborella trichopoda TaxID=13333 RepID=U5DA96_AMBTC|nr:hypothetical protein AMTR_s00061p00145890 [Amborella trichopoda]